MATASRAEDAELRHEALHVSPDRIDGEMQPRGHLGPGWCCSGGWR